MPITFLKNQAYISRAFSPHQPAPSERSFPYLHFGFNPGEVNKLAEALMEESGIQKPRLRAWRPDCLKETGMSVNLKELASLPLNQKERVEIFTGRLYKDVNQSIYTFGNNSRAFIAQRIVPSSSEIPTVHFFMPGYNESFLLHGDMLEKFIKKQGNKSFIFIMMDPPHQGLSNVLLNSQNSLTASSMGATQNLFQTWSKEIQELFRSPLFVERYNHLPLSFSAQSTGGITSLSAVSELLKDKTFHEDHLQQLNLVVPFIKAAKHGAVSSDLIRSAVRWWDDKRLSGAKLTLDPRLDDWRIPFTKDSLMAYWNTSAEKHYDNVFPALRGGLELGAQISLSRSQYEIYRKEVQRFIGTLPKIQKEYIPRDINILMATGYKKGDSTVSNQEIQALSQLLGKQTNISLVTSNKSDHNFYTASPDTVFSL